MLAPFLPSPRVPDSAFHGLPDPALLATLSAPAAEVVASVTQMRAEALAAVADLEDNRPGGRKWADALKADADAVTAPPKTWSAERLLLGDPARWARASAMARTLNSRATDALASIDPKPIRAAIAKRSSDRQAAFAQSAEAAYHSASAGQRPTAHRHLEQADTELQHLRDLDKISAWLDADPNPLRRSEGFAEWTRESGGHYEAARQLLGLTGDWIRLPDLTWPADFVPNQTTRPELLAWGAAR